MLLLTSASLRLDAAHRWQGSKADADQSLEFPRRRAGLVTTASGWRGASYTAAVPTAIKTAVLYEADAMADAELERIRTLIAAGVTGQSTGSLSDQFRAGFAGQDGDAKLCADADQLVQGYILTSGRIL